MTAYLRPSGSWVAMPTPFDKKGKIDFGAFKVLIDRQIEFGTSFLFVLGSAGEPTLLTQSEKHEVVRKVIALTKGRIPVFFSCNLPTTAASQKMARFCEAEGADGVIFLVPQYLLLPQSSVFDHLDACMKATSLPCGIYNNPSRVGVRIEPETIKKLSDANENFIVDKEAVPEVRQLVQVKRLCGDKLNILCCDYPKYSIVIPTLAVGGNGTANIGGNVMPAEVARYSRPWTSMKIMEECRQEYYRVYPLLEELYMLSNPIVVKAALNLLGLPGGPMRAPYQDYAGEPLARLRAVMDELGIIKKYGV